MFTHQIVQLPEYVRDYSRHGYASPELYLAVHYRELFYLQQFSWEVGGMLLIGLASVAGWLLGRVRRVKAA